MNSISLTGSPSRTRNVPSVHKAGLSLSHIASSILSSIWSNNGTCSPYYVIIISCWHCHSIDIKFYNWVRTCIIVKMKHWLTRRTRSRQMWRLMSLLRSVGSPFRRTSSSTPLVATHLYWSYFLTDCLNSGGSCLWCIHCSVSVLLILHSSNLIVVDWR